MNGKRAKLCMDIKLWIKEIVKVFSQKKKLDNMQKDSTNKWSTHNAHIQENLKLVLYLENYLVEYTICQKS